MNIRARLNSRYALLLVLGLLPLHAYSRADLLFTQYTNHPLILNPAFAGSRNSLAMDFFSRQQWVGMENAPASYYFSVHSPVNRTRVSLGASLISDQVGPLVSNHASAVYSHLTRINHRMFLSKGLVAGVDNFWLSFHDLDLVTITDPIFQKGIENRFNPVIGAGLVLFTPGYLVGISVPQALETSIAHGEDRNALFTKPRSLNLIAGYNLQPTAALGFRLSGFARILENSRDNYFLSVISLIDDFLRFGGTWHVDNTISMIIGVQVGRNWGITYSYDFPLTGLKPHVVGGQEITISLDSYRFFRRNRDRQFLKREVQEPDPVIRSIRHF